MAATLAVRAAMALQMAAASALLVRRMVGKALKALGPRLPRDRREVLIGSGAVAAWRLPAAAMTMRGRERMVSRKNIMAKEKSRRK